MDITQLRSSPSCERNQEPIRQVLEQEMPAQAKVLEIGSGTGQHAVYFTRAMPGLDWHCTDRGPDLDDLQLRLDHCADKPLPKAQVLDVTQAQWPDLQFDAAYSANTAHIMSWSMVCAMLQRLPERLKPDGLFFLYGPFSYDGAHTAESNQAFDQRLRAENPAMGIRDALELERQASISGLHLMRDIEMPANNRILIFKRESL
ncbi:MAG: class I SAM-dependent methyltransferase [Xanthomonadales bacterium]|jgi:SAM-dependent methyltransferase|nr:class I SAM-dependent methyltransferase [Xanthomonadales bacterium]